MPRREAGNLRLRVPVKSVMAGAGSTWTAVPMAFFAVGQRLLHSIRAAFGHPEQVVFSEMGAPPLADVQAVAGQFG